MDVVRCKFLPHSQVGTVLAEGSPDVAFAFLALPWTAVTFPGIFGIDQTTSSSSMGMKVALRK